MVERLGRAQLLVHTQLHLRHLLAAVVHLAQLLIRALAPVVRRVLPLVALVALPFYHLQVVVAAQVVVAVQFVLGVQVGVILHAEHLVARVAQRMGRLAQLARQPLAAAVELAVLLSKVETAALAELLVAAAVVVAVATSRHQALAAQAVLVMRRFGHGKQVRDS